MVGNATRSLATDRRVLVWLSLWIVNDWWLKPALGAGPLGLITGKLSDIAGLIVLSAWSGIVISVVTRRDRLDRPSFIAALAIPSLALVGLKSSHAMATSYEGALEAVTGLSHQVIVDPTDLVALIAVIPAARIMANPNPITKPIIGPIATPGRRSPHTSLLLGGLVVLVVATASSFEYTSYDDLGRTEQGHLAVRERDDNGHPVLTFSPDTDTWTDDRAAVDFGETTTEMCSIHTDGLCVRGVGEPLADEIQESTDGGQTWTGVWHVNGSEAWVRHVAGSEGDLQVGDIVETDDGHIGVAVGQLLPVVRSADGTWSPSVADLRVFPTTALLTLVPGLLTALSAAAAFGATGRKWWMAIAAIGVATMWLTPSVYSLSVFGFAHLPAAMGCAVVAAIAWPAAMRRVGDRRMAMLPLLTAMITVVAVIPLLLWAVGIGSWTPALVTTVVIATAAVGVVEWVAAGGRLPATVGMSR